MSEGRGARVAVVQPDQGESFWQPVPANGHVEIRISARRQPGIDALACGIQVVAPGCYIREHVHPAQDELLFCHAGQGTLLVDGEAHPFAAGTTAFVGAGHRHKIVNAGPAELQLLWTMLPGGANGLDAFFARIGRPRRPGEPAPEPFARPADVLAIEADTVFAPLPGAGAS